MKYVRLSIPLYLDGFTPRESLTTFQRAWKAPAVSRISGPVSEVRLGSTSEATPRLDRAFLKFRKRIECRGLDY